MKEKFNTSQNMEGSSWKEQLAELEETEGWARLSKKQQTMILASLSVQRRNDSGRYPYSMNRTREVVREYFCHFSVRSLELEEVPDLGEYRKLREKAETNKFFGDYFENISWQEGICNASDFEQEELPQVLYIGRKRGEPGFSREFVWKYHSCVVLGSGDEGDLLVWEKIAEKKPFALSNLRDVVERYPDANQFAYRPLKGKSNS